jgi:hypothetical protein
MNSEINMRLVDAAERMVDYLDKAYETTFRLERDNASRVVWLVALSGFAMINLPSLKATLPPLPIIMPWIATAVLGVITHWSHRDLGIRNFSLYTVKRELLLVFIINGPSLATFDTLNGIIKNEGDSLQRASKGVGRATTITTFLELLTFIGFVISIGCVIYWTLFGE